MLTMLPGDLLKLVASFMEKPLPLIQTCQAIHAPLSSDAHTVALWLLRQKSGGQALAALQTFSRTACALAWPTNIIHATVQHVLSLGTTDHSTPPAAPRLLPILYWAAVSLGDGPTLQLLLLGPKQNGGRHSAPMCPNLDPKLLGGQLLTDACAAGRAAAVAVLLAAGAEPRAGDASALQAAAEHGHADIVSALLSSSWADPHANDSCAMRMAASRGHAAVVELLLAAGCSPHAKQDEALSLAVGGGHMEVARALLRAGSDAHARTGVLLLAASSSQGPSEAEEGRSSGGLGSRSVDMVQLLLQAGVRDGDGAALCAAAEMGRGQLVELLLGSTTCLDPLAQQEAAGGKRSPAAMCTDVCNSYSLQPLSAALHLALQNGHLSVAQRLQEAGALVDATLLSSSSPFVDRQAALQLLDCLPCCRASLHSARGQGGPQGEELLSQAAAEPEDTFARLLLRWGADPTGHDCHALRTAVVHGRLACVRSIMGAAGVAALKREMPCCVMRVAIQRGHLEVVSELLSAGLWPGVASAHHCCSDPHTCPARLLCAASCSDMAALLLRSGGRAHAREALRLVACGKAPSWRSEAVVSAVMAAMVEQCLQHHEGRGLRQDGHGAGCDTEPQQRPGQQQGCCHEEEEQAAVELKSCSLV